MKEQENKDDGFVTSAVTAVTAIAAKTLHNILKNVLRFFLNFKSRVRERK